MSMVKIKEIPGGRIVGIPPKPTEPPKKPVPKK